MTKLKTLKDIERYICSGVYGDEGAFLDEDKEGDVIKIEELRQEAIKWIKKADLIYYCEDKHKSDMVDCEQSIKNWIKHFFNIKDGVENENNTP